MNSVGASSARETGILDGKASEVSLFSLYRLRVAYLIISVGLGVFVWPTVLRHTNEFAARRGIQVALLAGLGLISVLGLRYPVRMLPVLLFEFTWKVIYLLAFALPLWSAHQITPATAEDIKAVVMVVILIPLVPWSYVFAHYAIGRGERWR